MARSFRSTLTRRSYLKFYLKCALCVLIIYYLNLFFGWKYYMWSEKSFEREYGLRMFHIDAIAIDENPEQVFGPPKNLLPNRFLINNEYLCGRALDPSMRLSPHLLILVRSFAEHVKERAAIRATWGNKTHLKEEDVRLVFVLGTDKHNPNVGDEAKKYGDIIQIDIDDYFHYSSHKMVMMLRWITDYCVSQTHHFLYQDLRNYVLFVDDDYFVDINALSLYIRSVNEDPVMTTYERRTFITGEVIQGSRPHRSVTNGYYISLNDYPYDVYPSHVLSGCFLMTRYNARLFYIASKYVRLFKFDHIYMGLLAYSMSIDFIQNKELFPVSMSATTNGTKFFSKWNDLFHRRTEIPMGKHPICLHGYSAEKLINFWEEIHSVNSHV